MFRLLHELLARSIEEQRASRARHLRQILLSDPGFSPRSHRPRASHVGPCKGCSRLYHALDLQAGLCPECRARAHHGFRPRLESVRCAGCGMRFSVNLIRDGLCGACRDADGREDRGRNLAGASEPGLKRAYEILGCEESQSDHEIKSRRRSLVKECHTDRLPADAPPPEVERAQSRFRDIQEAYDTVMEDRRRSRKD